ncbi:MAG: hypothetical protein JWO09_339 [Bacteroidetes bacterium]|nr:hypothetical protein [Bacteroidota bacterium]
MKKSVLIGLLVAIGSTTIMSCKKDYYCQCTKVYTYSNGSTSTSEDDVYTFRDTRARAESKCNDQESTGTSITGGSYSRECEIK